MLLQKAPELATVEAVGSDVRTWLNGMVTCDLLPRKVGEGAFGLCVGKTGKILAEVYIALAAADRFLIGMRHTAVAGILEHFDKHLVMEDVTVNDLSADHAWAFLHGDGVRDLAGTVSGGGAGFFPIDFTGKGSFAVIAPAAKANELWAALVSEGVHIATEDEWNDYRVRNGVAAFGSDFDEHSYAQEAALERVAVSFSKGCYLGQEAVFMLQVRGHVKKRLVQLVVEGEGARPGVPITVADGTEVGLITSTSPSDPRLSLGHVKYKYAKPGEAFLVAGVPARSTEVIPAPKEG
ncbi:MAG: aminomethyl transferase family protein [Polyangiaceae bacterium]|nr:aminomethyl transferase family protein [Polyangiaceae bacterium]